jgi:hypothetical protein
VINVVGLGRENSVDGKDTLVRLDRPEVKKQGTIV